MRRLSPPVRARCRLRPRDARDRVRLEQQGQDRRQVEDRPAPGSTEQAKCSKLGPDVYFEFKADGTLTIGVPGPTRTRSRRWTRLGQRRSPGAASTSCSRRQRRVLRHAGRQEGRRRFFGKKDKPDQDQDRRRQHDHHRSDGTGKLDPNEVTRARPRVSRRARRARPRSPGKPAASHLRRGSAMTRLLLALRRRSPRRHRRRSPRERPVTALAAYPAALKLSGMDDAPQLVVTGTRADGRDDRPDRATRPTPSPTRRSSASTPTGRVFPLANGTAEITVDRSTARR